ncbi:PREDICTED: AMSH-like ubiquitin thioesterase 1 [Ipomoea nil]|uniref:AMSH-like ubiquitin thioesterase 1 n=1 Tax=Ipomoea nil TaxID=35883 RepID=UPI000900DB91|nr:PREDICTED: AMSH-like ubiquitin thioesterase 1 [Ipomoea nil]
MITRSPSSSGRINIASSAKKLDVDHRFSLRVYFRIADNILRQADIFREEGNIIDLYVMLLRFSSLVSETIPCHRDYRLSSQSNKIYLRKKLLNAVAELEELKPGVQKKIEELNRRSTYQANKWSNNHQNNLIGPPKDLHLVKKQNFSSYGTKAPPYATQEFLSQGPRSQQLTLAKPVDEQFLRLSISMPRPKEETLTRHSILGPNGLRGQWQPPISNMGVTYPTNIDLTPVEIPRGNGLQQIEGDGALVKKDDSISLERPKPESTIPINNDNSMPRAEEPPSLISFETEESPKNTQVTQQPSPSPVLAEVQDLIPPPQVVRQPSPPPVLAEVQDLIPKSSPQVLETEGGLDNPMPDNLVRSEDPLQLHISTALMDSFMKLAKSNTNKNLETCGVLAGSLKNRKFYITALIIPKQESTSDSCQTTNEEEIFEVQDKRSLFPLGWIHTHPTQSCFMSSIDVHTQYSYQVMLPEAIAIVMAPKDCSRNHGIFRLTNPGGMTVIRQCPRRGFHAHDPPADGSPIYKHCTDVYMSSTLKFDVIDLR